MVVCTFQGIGPFYLSCQVYVSKLFIVLLYFPFNVCTTSCFISDLVDLCLRCFVFVGLFSLLILLVFSKNHVLGTSLAVQWLRLCLPMQGVQVQSLVGELRSPMPRGQKNQNIKQKQYCNKFNKDFKNGPHQKKIYKKERKYKVRIKGRKDHVLGVKAQDEKCHKRQI